MNEGTHYFHNEGFQILTTMLLIIQVFWEARQSRYRLFHPDHLDLVEEEKEEEKESIIQKRQRRWRERREEENKNKKQMLRKS